jgi:hypothetical protein
MALSGTVRSFDGLPIPGATVVLRQGPQRQTAIADAAGSFSFPDAMLPAVVEVSARGFTMIRRTVETSPADFLLFPAGLTESVNVVSKDTNGHLSGADTRAEIEKVPALTPDEVLRTVSGFSLFRRTSSRASNPTTHGVTMRGLSASGSSRGRDCRPTRSTTSQSLEAPAATCTARTRSAASSPWARRRRAGVRCH